MQLRASRGFADFVFLPKPEYKEDYLALVVELKWNQKAQTAMQQIKDKKYPDSILAYTGKLLQKSGGKAKKLFAIIGQ